MADRQPAQAGREEQSGSGSTIRSILQSVLMFVAIQFVMKQFMGGGSKQADPAAGSQPGVKGGVPSVVPAWEARPLSIDPDVSYSPLPQFIGPMWPVDTPLDIIVVLSPSIVVPSIKKTSDIFKVVDEKNFRLGDKKDTREISTTFPVFREVQNNGTLWAHLFVSVSGFPLDPEDPEYDTSKAFNFPRPLNQYLVKKKKAKTHNLLAAKNETEVVEEEPEPKGPIVSSFYHPNFTVALIPDSGTMNYPSLHPAMRQFVQLERTGARDASGQNGWYYPIVFPNTFWQLRDHMSELNSTVETLPLHITLTNMRNWMFSIYASMDEGMKQQQKQAAFGGSLPSGGDGTEFEEFKRILVDTNMYLLGTTAVVSVLHMVFEMLAFKSDISHWRNKKDNVGVSVRSILGNVFMQTVIFLYLIDNSDGTSWMILFSQGMGIVLEAWKITKTVDVRVRPAPAGSLLPYHITFEDKHKLSETEKKTQEYDQIAFKYLYIIAIPLLLAYAVYSLIYDTHKSWYSFIITTLVGSVYAYGFLMMAPSLYINYRLKSVAHMPRKAMMYKFLNTFIDDLFAFTIKMPTLHRLATLRDDVIFFVYLYQAWKYKVDYTRVNEFGQGGEDEPVEEKLANEPLKAPAPGKEAKEIADATTSGASKADGATKRK